MIAPLGEPGCAIHTPKPNFGKVEYFCEGGLTGWRVFFPMANLQTGDKHDELNHKRAIGQAIFAGAYTFDQEVEQ